MADLSTNLQNYFPKATRDCYWHYVVAHHSSENFYTVEKTQEMVAKLNFFDRRSTKGYTPLHVAVLGNNKPATTFLLDRGANPMIRDEEGKTAYDCSSPNIRPLFKENKNFIDFDLADPLWKRWRVDLPKKVVTYQAHTHDFGVKLKHLLMVRPDEENYPTLNSPTCVSKGLKIDWLAKNMAKIAEEEGFKLSYTNSAYHPRDSFIRLPDGTFILPQYSKNHKQAIERTESRNLVMHATSSKKAHHLFFSIQIGASENKKNCAIEDFVGRFKHSKACRFFFEGGHHFVLSNSQGKTKLLVGESLFFIILNQFELDQIFKDPLIDLSVYKKFFEAKLDEELIQYNLQEMHAQGWLAKGDKGLITTKEATEIEGIACHRSSEKNLRLEIAEAKNFFKAFDGSKLQQNERRQIVAEYMAKKKITREIIAKTFGMNETDMHCIEDTEFHLDASLHPGPNCVFQQDYYFTLAILQYIKEKKAELQLTSEDEIILDRYISTTKELAFQLHSLTESTRKRLKEFFVVPVPGIIYDKNPLEGNPIHPEEVKTYNINFINGITAYSEKNKYFIYIASGASVGDRLGTILMKIYTSIIQYYAPNTKVYYIGHDPQNPHNFKEAMAWWNLVPFQAGPHCFSQELETESYTG